MKKTILAAALLGGTMIAGAAAALRPWLGRLWSLLVLLQKAGQPGIVRPGQPELETPARSHHRRGQAGVGGQQQMAVSAHHLPQFINLSLRQIRYRMERLGIGAETGEAP